MPARDFITGFTFDPATFNFDAFKDTLVRELTADEDLANTKISALTESNTALTESEKNLKIKLFDATVMRQGDKVAPTDSTTAGSGPAPSPVPDTDIFEKVQ